MFKGRFSSTGTLTFGAYTRNKLKDFIKANPNLPFEIVPLTPESRKQRAYFEGAICPLVAYYQENLDFRNPENVRKVREFLKIEFNGEFITLGGKSVKIAQSTKRKLNQGFLERVIGWIEDNYAPPAEALNPESYKYWRDHVYPMGGPETYIEYLIEKNILTK